MNNIQYNHSSKRIKIELNNSGNSNAININSRIGNGYRKATFRFVESEFEYLSEAGLDFKIYCRLSKLVNDSESAYKESLKKLDNCPFNDARCAVQDLYKLYVSEYTVNPDAASVEFLESLDLLLLNELSLHEAYDVFYMYIEASVSLCKFDSNYDMANNFFDLYLFLGINENTIHAEFFRILNELEVADNMTSYVSMTNHYYDHFLLDMGKSELEVLSNFYRNSHSLFSQLLIERIASKSKAGADHGPNLRKGG